MSREMERRRDADDGGDTGTRIAYLLVGAGIGAVVALLFAPKSGHELRVDIADATRKSIDRTRDAANQLGERATDYYEGARDRASELYSAGRERAGEVADAAKQRGGSFSAALEAGKQAYREEKRKTEVTGLPATPPNYYEEQKS